MARRKEMVIVGNGMATCRLLDELVARGAQERYGISVVGDEPGGAYNRVMLSKVLAGNEPDVIVTKPPAWYEEHGVRLVAPCVAERIDLAERGSSCGLPLHSATTSPSWRDCSATPESACRHSATKSGSRPPHAGHASDGWKPPA